MSITAKPEAHYDFRIRHIRALRGPNYWRLAPVVACDVRLGKLEHVSSTDMPWRELARIPRWGHTSTRLNRKPR
ncbi:MAG: hypothetical protein ACSLFK_02780 [Gemmatimonadaceae bacterium]